MIKVKLKCSVKIVIVFALKLIFQSIENLNIVEIILNPYRIKFDSCLFDFNINNEINKITII